MATILSQNTIDRIEEALQSCLDEMKVINEPCDHAAGICLCSFHSAMERADYALWLMRQTIGVQEHDTYKEV
jgi:hypothetical protein